jgi:hypothetical protein
MNHILKNSSIDIPFSHRLTWQQLGLGIVAVTALAALVGLLVASTVPRGPVTTRQALSVIAINLVTGIVAGLVLRSKWAMLLAPLIYGAAFELGRIGTSGPLVDMPSLGTTFGILALILGRGVHALLAGLPMVLGVLYGLILIRWRSSGDASSTVGYAGYAVTGVLTLLLGALIVLITLPASTPPILGPASKPVPGGIAVLEKVDLGGPNSGSRSADTARTIPCCSISAADLDRAICPFRELSLRI